jgi:hypothetical protein
LFLGRSKVQAQPCTSLRLASCWTAGGGCIPACPGGWTLLSRVRGNNANTRFIGLCGQSF